MSRLKWLCRTSYNSVITTGYGGVRYTTVDYNRLQWLWLVTTSYSEQVTITVW